MFLKSVAMECWPLVRCKCLQAVPKGVSRRDFHSTGDPVKGLPRIVILLQLEKAGTMCSIKSNKPAMTAAELRNS